MALAGSAAVRRAQQAGAVEPALLENAFAVGEGLEAELAVIGAHAGGADAAERQVLDDDVHQRLVDRNSPETVLRSTLSRSAVSRRNSRAPAAADGD